MNLILASKSPRRQEILNQLGIKFTVKASDFVELDIVGCLPKQLVMKNACGKAWSLKDEYDANEIILAADTIVVYDGKILEKPKDFEDAVSILTILSGKTHKVLTAICLINKGNTFTAIEETLVTMRNISKKEIESYVNTGEPFDKAGAYGIQAKGALFVEKIDGCYYNVVGLPVVRLWELFKEAGIDFDYQTNAFR